MRLDFRHAKKPVKTFLFLGLSLHLGLLNQPLAHAAPPTSRLSASVKGEWRAVNRTANQTRWQSITWRTNMATLRAHAYTNSYVELGGGLNLKNGAGDFVAANPAFRITATGAEATNCAHSIRLAADICSENPVVLTTPEKVRLVSSPMAICYYDPVDGRTVPIAFVTNSIGTIVNPATVLYTNCFHGLKASLRYCNRHSEFEQDLLLHELPPPPSALGLSAKSRLELWTQIDSEVGPAVSKTVTLSRETDSVARASMWEPDFVDQKLAFGSSVMGLGRAFRQRPATNSTASFGDVSVGKSYQVINGRGLLIEAVPYAAISAELQKIRNPGSSGITNAAATPRKDRALVFDEIQMAMNYGNSHTGSMLAARIDFLPADSFVIDYIIQDPSTSNDSTYRSGTTYLITGPISHSAVVIEPGAIIKFDDYGAITVLGQIDCRAQPHIPAILTVKDDDNVGEQIAGSTGSPQWTYNPMLNISGNQTLKNMRFNHAWTAFLVTAGELNIWHSQFINAGVPITVAENADPTVNFYNVLFSGYSYMIGTWDNTRGNFHGQHVTASGQSMSLYLPGDTTLSFVNSVTDGNLFESVALTLDHTTWGTATAQDFQYAFGGQYLALDSSLRDAGTTQIHPALLSDLIGRATTAPQLVTGAQPAVVFEPQDIEDSGLPDLGYHPDPIDFVMDNVTIENSTLTLTAGVRVAAHNVTISDGGSVISVGTPTKLNKVFQLNNVVPALQPNGGIFVDAVTPTFSGTALFKFTQFSGLSTGCRYFEGHGRIQSIAMSDCQLHAGWFGDIPGASPPSRTMNFRNNLFNHSQLEFWQADSTQTTFANNTFNEAGLAVIGGTLPQNAWLAENNFFNRANVSFSFSGVLVNRYNGYVFGPLPNSSGGDQLLSDVQFQPGPLGYFYIPQTYGLVNHGSGTAASLGYYHYTTAAAQTPEGSSTLDMGFHFVVVNWTGAPIDSDNEGLADYLEDSNGNGLTDTGETRFAIVTTDVDTDGDGISDYLETLEGRSATSQGFAPDTSGTINLRLFTPLKQ